MTELEQIIKMSRDDKLNILKAAMFTSLLRIFFTSPDIPLKQVTVYDRLKECIRILNNQEYEQWRDNITGNNRQQEESEDRKNGKKKNVQPRCSRH